MVFKKWLSALFLFVVLTSSFYVIFDDKIRIDVQKTRTEYRANVGDTWELAAREYVYVFDGTTKMRAKSRIITNQSIGDFLVFKRYAYYKDNISTLQTYTFDTTVTDIELVPIEHKTECFNCEGKIVHFEYRNILYDGITRLAISPESFGFKMKVEWESDYDWAKVYQQKYTSDKLIIRYRPNTAHETYYVRLFDPDDYLKLNGVASNRYYEYQTTVSIGTNYTHYTIYDDTGRIINVSTGTGSDKLINYTIDLLRYGIENGTTIKNVSEIDSRDNIYNASFNISGEDVVNAELNYSTQSIFFPGILKKDGTLFQNNFSYLGVPYINYNLSFRVAETKTIYINYSAEGQLNRSGKFNYTLTAFELDGDNIFNYTENMEFLNTTDAVYVGTITNATDPHKEYKDVTESFLNNDTESRWEYTAYSGFQTSCNDNLGFTIAEGCVKSVCFGLTPCAPGVNYVRSGDYYPLADLSYFTIQAYGYANDGGNAYLDFTDLTNIKTITSLQSTIGSCHWQYGCSAEARLNLTFKKVDDTTWNVSGDCKTTIVQQGIATCGFTEAGTLFDISSLGETYYLAWRFTRSSCSYLHGNCNARAFFSRFGIKGPQLNKTNMSYYSGVEGVGSDTHTGNFSTSILQSTTSDVSRVTLSAVTLEPTGTSISYYLSNDDGTTYEPVTLDETHLFSSTGNQIKAKFELSSTNNLSSPIVTSFFVKTESSILQGLRVDVGGDGIDESGYDYELNTTSTPVYYLVNNTDAFSLYIDENCDGATYCLIPIEFTSSSAGIIEITNVNLSTNINPVELNYSLFQDDEYLILHSNENVFMDDFKFDYEGSKNITVSAHNSSYSGSINRTIIVRYSPIDVAFPPHISYYDVFPLHLSSKNIEPFGQKTGRIFDVSVPIFNITTTAYDDPVHIYEFFSPAIDSCLVLKSCDSWNNTNCIETNISKQYLGNITLTTGDFLPVYHYWNLTACSFSTYLPSNFTHKAYCEQCVVVD